MKKVFIGSFIIMVIYFFYSIFSSLDFSPTFSEADNLQEAKKAADSFIDVWKENYEELCKKERTQDLKYEFLELGIAIGTAWDVKSFCKKLSEDDKQKALDYTLSTLRKEKNLIDLEKSKINCW